MGTTAEVTDQKDGSLSLHFPKGLELPIAAGQFVGNADRGLCFRFLDDFSVGLSDGILLDVLRGFFENRTRREPKEIAERLPEVGEKTKKDFGSVRYYSAYSGPGLTTLNGGAVSSSELSEFLKSDHRKEMLSPRGVSIVILSGDNTGYLSKCLDSVEKYAEDVYEVVIVSNAKQASTVNFLKGLDRYRFNSIAQVCDDGMKFGFGKFCNLGISNWVGGDYILFLNDDTETHEGWLRAMKKILFLDPTVGIVGSKILSMEDGKIQHIGMGLDRPGGPLAFHPFFGADPGLPEVCQDREMDAVTGACMMVRQGDFERLGGFDEMYEGGFYEDTDLCLRMKQDLGKKCVYCSSSEVVHKLGASFTSEDGYMGANEAKFRKRWEGKIENNSYRFTGKKSLYRPKSALILDSFVGTAGGGERAVCGLAKVLSERYHVSIVVNQRDFVEDAVRARLQDLLGYDLWGIDFLQWKDAKEASWDVFVNGEWSSIEQGIGKDQSLFFLMFPNAMQHPQFLGSYDTLVANSRFTQRHILEQWNRRSEVIYPPVPLPESLPDNKKEDIILSVGRFFAAGGSKKQEILIDAFARIAEWQLKGSKRSFEFHLAGSYDEDSQIDREYVEMLEDRAKGIDGIHFHFNASCSELGDLYRRAKIFWAATGFGETSPLEQEHFGIVVVEAMSRGCYPLIFDGGGQAETIREIGWGETWKTTEQLVRQTKIIMEGKDDLSSVPFHTLKELYGIERFRRQVLALLED